MSRWRGIVVVACTFLFGSAAWSQSAGGKLPHACEILTVEDAEYAFGKGARLVRGGGGCNIQPEDNKFLTLGVIRADITNTSDDFWAAKKRLFMMSQERSIRAPTKGIVLISVNQVSGLGDDAYMVLGNLSIKKGAAEVTVSGLYTDFAKREEALRYIGEKLLARIPN